jgi:hypothetical protein
MPVNDSEQHDAALRHIALHEHTVLVGVSTGITLLGRVTDVELQFIPQLGAQPVRRSDSMSSRAPTLSGWRPRCGRESTLCHAASTTAKLGGGYSASGVAQPRKLNADLL